MSKKDYLFIGCVSFLFTLFIGLFIDFIVLPHFLPQHHAGNGLFKGFDSVYLHDTAVKIAQGDPFEWLKHKFQFGDCSVYVGLQALIYKLTITEPVILLPVSCAAIAISTILLAAIVCRIVENKRAVILCVFPFFVFPSSLQWYAQWNKEPFFIMGALMVFYSFTGLMNEDNIKSIKPILYVLFLISGYVICFFLRPYAIYFLSCSLSIASLVLCLVCLLGYRKIKPFLIRNIVWTGVAIVLMFSLVNWSFYQNRSTYVNEINQIENSFNSKESDLEQPNVVRFTFNQDTVFFLPDVIEEYIYKLSYFRARFLFHHSDARTNFDTDIEINSSRAFFLYIPKLMFVSYFYPTPGLLMAPGGNFMQPIILIEMIILYVGLVCFIFSFWKSKRKENFMFLLFSLTVYICLAAFIAPNIGTFYRYRYVFIMMIICTGWAEILKNTALIHTIETFISNVSVKLKT